MYTPKRAKCFVQVPSGLGFDRLIWVRRGAKQSSIQGSLHEKIHVIVPQESPLPEDTVMLSIAVVTNIMCICSFLPFASLRWILPFSFADAGPPYRLAWMSSALGAWTQLILPSAFASRTCSKTWTWSVNSQTEEASRTSL